MKILLGTCATAAVIFLLLLFLVLGVYKYDYDNRALQLVEKIIPFPAVYIKNIGPISISEIKENEQSVKKFYESQDFDQLGMRIDFSTEQGQKRLRIKEKEIINKLIENKIIETLAEERGIRIDSATIDQEVDSSIAQYGNRQNLMSELARLYGWSLEDFKKKVVEPDMAAERLSNSYYENLDTGPQEAKIRSLWERVTAKKEDFSKVAQESSEGDSSKNGGDLGWSSKSQLISEIADKAYSMRTGEISSVIESPLGFHVLKLEEKKSEDGEDMVHLRQIFVKIPTFGDWLKGQMKNCRVFVFIKGYQWNREEARIEFSDPDLRRFEENLDANSQGDPSVFP